MMIKVERKVSNFEEISPDKQVLETAQMRERERKARKKAR